MHGIASRGDLPLPFSFVVVGAALRADRLVRRVAVRLAHAAVHRGRRPTGTRACSASSTIAAYGSAASLLVLALFAWVGLALVAGQDRLTNPAFGFVFVWIWVGLVPLSLLFGQVWRATNPLRTIHAGSDALARVDPDAGLASLPGRLGRLAGGRRLVRVRLAGAGAARPDHACRCCGSGSWPGC